MVVLKKILVATDFSKASGTALEYGRELARTSGATLEVLHVSENVMSRTRRSLPSSPSPRCRSRSRTRPGSA